MLKGILDMFPHTRNIKVINTDISKATWRDNIYGKFSEYNKNI